MTNATATRLQELIFREQLEGIDGSFDFFHKELDLKDETISLEIKEALHSWVVDNHWDLFRHCDHIHGTFEFDLDCEKAEEIKISFDGYEENADGINQYDPPLFWYSN